MIFSANMIIPFLFFYHLFYDIFLKKSIVLYNKLQIVHLDCYHKIEFYVGLWYNKVMSKKPLKKWRMTQMNINKAILQYHAENQYETIFVGAEALEDKKPHIANVITLSKAIARVQHSPVDYSFLALCAEHHDDGRVDQYKILGGFLDTEILHHVLSVKRFDEFLLQNHIDEMDDSIKIFRDVMLYHGRMEVADLSDESKLYVQIISVADDFENACSCVSYLVREVQTDAKGYIREKPKNNQKFVSTFVWEHFCKGKKFDKMKYCHTYAEYVLFAATLATSCIKKYGDIARAALSQAGYGYSSILEGYKDVFSKTLSPDMAEEAYDTLVSMVL